MSKRKRTEVTAVHKKKLCVWKQDHPRASLEDMRQYAESDLQLKIGKSTCGDIWKSRGKWSAADPSSPSGSRLRTPANHQLESALVMWLNDVVSRGACPATHVPGSACPAKRVACARQRQRPCPATLAVRTPLRRTAMRHRYP